VIASYIVMLYAPVLLPFGGFGLNLLSNWPIILVTSIVYAYLFSCILAFVFSLGQKPNKCVVLN
ncbi:MAG: hypothetical protein ABIE23_01520, partial [archaeon]